LHFEGTLTNVFSTIVAMSKKTKINALNPREEQDEEKLPLTTETNLVAEKTTARYNPIRKYETGAAVRSMADVDAELALLQM